jgi:hypothetical protein
MYSSKNILLFASFSSLHRHPLPGHVFAYKSPKTPFFAIKYLTRYTHETFFEEYINFKIFRNAIAELYLFEVSEVIYAPSRTD